MTDQGPMDSTWKTGPPTGPGLWWVAILDDPNPAFVWIRSGAKGAEYFEINRTDGNWSGPWPIDELTMMANHAPALPPEVTDD